MKTGRFLSIVIIVLLFSSNYVSAQISMQSRTSFEKNKTKKNKVKYKWHEGHALLKSGLKIKGKFKFHSVKNDVPHWIYLENKKGAKKKFIDVSLYQYLTLFGNEKNVVETSDSTFFEWVDQYDNLLRKVKSGKISVYDNSNIISEKYKSLNNFYVVAVKSDGQARKLAEIKDLSFLLADDPYYKDAVRVTGKSETRDLRVMFYLIDIYNSNNPMELLKWDNIELTVRGGKTIKGKGLIQPFDLRNEYNTPKEAMIHFWNEQDGFAVYADNQVKKVTSKGKIWNLGYYPLTDKNFWGMTWNYQNREFLVTTTITNRNSFYFQPRATEKAQSIIILENLAGSYKKPQDEPHLRQKFLETYKF